MHIVLVSDVLTIEDAEVSLSPDSGSHAEGGATLATARVRDNEIRNFPYIGPGERQLVFMNCSIRSRRSDRVYHVPFFRVDISLAPSEAPHETVHVPLGPNVFARVEAVGENGVRLTRDHLFGVALPGMSIEVKGPEHSPLYALLPPGEYFAYLADDQPVHVPFVIGDRDELREVTIRQPAKIG